MKKKINGIYLVIAMLVISVLAVGCGGSKDKQQAPQAAAKSDIVTIKLAHTSAEGTTIYKTYDKFKELVEKNSSGKIKVEVFPASALGGDQALVEAAKRGSIDIGSCGTNNLSQFSNLYLWADLPYVFKSLDGVHKVYGGPIGDEMKKKFQDEQKDLIVLFYADPGSFRNFMNSKKEIKTPEDAKGLKIRTAASPVEQAIVRAFGAAPTPVSWPEVYMALEQKVVDGELQQYHWIVTAKHQEIIKYVSEIGGQHALHLAVMSKLTWDKLTPDQQKIVADAAKEAQKFNFDNAEKFNNDLRQVVIKAGVKIYNPTPDEMKQWEKAGQKVWDEYKDKVSRELIDRVLKAQE
ncbi:MAG: TRAP transporter substrate-binding protein [Desulfocucumaceae bacterium]